MKGQKLKKKICYVTCYNYNERHSWHLNVSHSLLSLLSLAVVSLNTSVNVFHCRSEMSLSAASRLELDIDPWFSFRSYPNLEFK